MSSLLLVKEFYEHENQTEIKDVSHAINKTILFRSKKDRVCADVVSGEQSKSISTSYYIGADWLIDNELAILISPKLSKGKGAAKVDYLQMLFSCLQHPDVLYHTQELYEIKFDQPTIQLEQKNDQLTPLLVVHFAQVLRTIVAKGLKKSYYRVERNLAGKVKGKILINKTVKHNVLKHRLSHTVCSFDEFGLNSIDNRLLKKAMLFCQRYLSAFPEYQKYASPVLGFCAPAFELVEDQVEVHEVKSVKPNAFFKEYAEGIRLAKMILRRFGYNIKNTEKTKIVETPPFWVDMARLFELYVLGKLKERFGSKVAYHFTRQYNELDYLLNTEDEKIVIDAKYKPQYRDSYEIDDIRQLSGYSRLTSVAESLGYKTEEEQAKAVIDCLIIYPNQDAAMSLGDRLKEEKIPQFVSFFKHGIKLPVIGL